MSIYYYSRWNSEYAFRKWKEQCNDGTATYEWVRMCHSTRIIDSEKLEKLVADKCEDPGDTRYIRIEREDLPHRGIHHDSDVDFKTIRDNIEDYCNETAKCKVKCRRAGMMLVRFNGPHRGASFIRSIDAKKKE